MDIFPEVRAKIEAVLTRLRLEGHWTRTTWKDIPFAIIHNEEAILQAVSLRDPGKKFRDLDTILETTGVVAWGYDSEFEVCPRCKQVKQIEDSDEHHICDIDKT